MLERPIKSILGQFSHPHGRAAPFVAAFLNVVNAPMNRAAVRAATAGGAQRVLDVGFGGGPALARLLRQGVPHVAGVDISDEMVAQGRKRFGAAHLAQAAVEALPFDDGSFDAVVSVNSAQFWPDRVAGLLEIRRVLVPGGRLVLAFDPGPARIFKKAVEEAGYQALPGRAELLAAVETAGFTGIESPRATLTGTLIVGVSPGPATAS